MKMKFLKKLSFRSLIFSQMTSGSARIVYAFWFADKLVIHWNCAVCTQFIYLMLNYTHSTQLVIQLAQSVVFATEFCGFLLVRYYSCN